MLVKLKFHSAARPAYLRWFTALGKNDLERKLSMKLHLEEMKLRLEMCKGTPPEAYQDEHDSNNYWWHYGRVVFHYRLTDSPPLPGGWWDIKRIFAGLIWARERTVLILDVLDPP